MHTPGYEGWTVSRYRQFPGPTPNGLPDSILRDLDRDGVDATMLFPNLSFFALYTDLHERSIAHARVYNDWLAESFLHRPEVFVPAAIVPVRDVASATAELQRVAALGFRTALIPTTPPPSTMPQTATSSSWEPDLSDKLPRCCWPSADFK